VIDRKLLRFRRLVERHGEVLDLFADLKEKQAGDYILDRQYIEANLDRAYEGVRQVLYDMHVLSDSESGEGYDQLDGLRSVSEKILREASEHPDEKGGLNGEEEPDWETLALKDLLQDLTRVSDNEANGGSRLEIEPPLPQSLVEWARWGHMKAAQWITENLPSLSVAPTTNLCGGETEAFLIRVFLMGGVSKPEDALRQCLAEGPSLRTEVPSLLPLSYFLEGLRHTSNGSAGPQIRLADSRKLGARDPAETLQLYAGEGFLLLLLPSFLPVRLFCCSLSVHESENLLYLYGNPPPSLFEQLACGPSSQQQQVFPAHQCAASGTWMYWASHFSWAQGEERVRMLGGALAECMKAAGNGASQEDVNKCLEKEITGFLNQVALSHRVSASS
jgi:hypothetical protein